jgi:hypothetical protein
LSSRVAAAFLSAVRGLPERLAVSALLVAPLAFGGCTMESERETLLPWLRVETTHRAFGSFGGNTQARYYVKYYGFWRGLDVWMVVVLDPANVLVRNEEGYGVLHQGSLRPVPVCAKTSSLTVPPGSAVLDCVDSAAHTDGELTGLRWRRFALSGEVLEERAVSALGAGRIFPPAPQLLVYDDDGAPYFLMMNAAAARDYRVQPTDCALLSARHSAPAPVAGPPQMSWNECRQPAAWERAAGRRLHGAGLPAP